MKVRSLLASLIAIALLPLGAAPASAATTHAHVAVIVEENRNLDQVIGDPGMPYLNGLAKTYSSFTTWRNLVHPSEPNYIAMVAGSTLGVTDDGHHDFGATANLGAQLTAAGVSWKAYMEDLPSVGYTGDTYANYARKHDPFIMFSNNGAHVVPASQYWTDLKAGTLPDFIYYVPNLINDGHDAGDPTVDASLRSLVPPLLSSAWYASGGTVIVAYDEDEGQGVFPMVIVSENARSHANFAGNHYGTLRTIEETYGLPLLGGASGGTSFRSILGGTVTSPPPTTSTFAVTATLDAPTFAQGGTMSGRVTVTSSADATLQRVVLAARPPGGTVNGGPYLDVGSATNVALKAGVPTTISASRAVTTSDPVGSWIAFAAIQKPDGSWQNGATSGFSVTAAPTPGPAPAPGTTPQVTLADVNGNAWWVQAHVSGADAARVTKIEAQVGTGAWTNLPHQSWGDWAASMPAPSGSLVTFRATLTDGRTATSCAFVHPTGACVGTGTSTFTATFSNKRGNAWWVETNVATSGGTLAGVDAMADNTGTWVPLAKTSWGSWAASVHVTASVQLRARSADGHAVVAGPFAWPP